MQRMRIDRAVKKASFLERSNQANVYSSTVSFRRADATPTSFSSAPTNIREEYGRIAGRDQSRAMKLQAITNNYSDMEDVDQFSRQLEEVEADIMHDEAELSAAIPSAQSSTGNGDSFEAILQSLLVEPTDEDEIAAKYALFENFLNTVVVLRDQTMLFWRENKDQFSGGAIHACEKDIRQIDSNDSMGIFDESGGVWFVYHMMKKANQNSKAISKVLNTLKSRLEMLSARDLECPFCLESIDAQGEETLSCCHKCCKDCWSNWVEIKGHGAFCPLCKHPQFVEELFSEI